MMHQDTRLLNQHWGVSFFLPFWIKIHGNDTSICRTKEKQQKKIFCPANAVRSTHSMVKIYNTVFLNVPLPGSKICQRQEKDNLIFLFFEFICVPFSGLKGEKIVWSVCWKKPVSYDLLYCQNWQWEYNDATSIEEGWFSIITDHKLRLFVYNWYA